MTHSFLRGKDIIRNSVLAASVVECLAPLVASCKTCTPRLLVVRGRGRAVFSELMRPLSDNRVVGLELLQADLSHGYITEAPNEE